LNLIIAEEKLTQTFARVACFNKTLKHTKDKVAEKTLCLACKLADDNDDVFRDKKNLEF